MVLLFGELRLIETEHIFERIGISLVSSLFSLATFRVENFLVSGTLTGAVLALKVYHWILGDRMDALERVSDVLELHSIKRLLVNRTVLALAIILFLDYRFVLFCNSCLYNLPLDIYIAYEFEVSLLALDIVFLLVKLGVDVVEILYLQKNDEEEWERKGIVVQFCELAHTFVKLVVNLLLLFIFLNPVYFPIHVVRNCYMCGLEFYRKLLAIVHYINNAKRLDRDLADATEEELAEGDMCIICREDMSLEGVPAGHKNRPKKLACGHIIHLGCLKSWLKISQLCPMCRSKVFSEGPSPSQSQGPNQNQNHNQNQNQNQNHNQNQNQDQNQNQNQHQNNQAWGFDNIANAPANLQAAVAPEPIPLARALNEMARPRPTPTTGTPSTESHSESATEAQLVDNPDQMFTSSSKRTVYVNEDMPTQTDHTIFQIKETEIPNTYLIGLNDNTWAVLKRIPPKTEII